MLSSLPRGVLDTQLGTEARTIDERIINSVFWVSEKATVLAVFSENLSIFTAINFDYILMNINSCQIGNMHSGKDIVVKLSWLQ